MICPKCKGEDLEYLGSITWRYDKSKLPVVKLNHLKCRSCKHKWRYK